MEDFMRNRWKELARAQSGPAVLDKDDDYRVRSYEELKETIGNLPDRLSAEEREDLSSIFADLQDSIRHYVAAIKALDLSRPEQDDWRRMEQLDQNRSMAHDALLANFDILQRLMKKAGLDVSWRDKVGTSREDAQNWAQAVFESLDSVKEK